MKITPKILLLLGSLLISLFVFEVGVRLMDLDYNPHPYWRFHPKLGWTQERDATFDLQVGGIPVHIEFNKQGFRDIDHSVEKPAGTRRIVILGDSFSEAVQVNLEETYWRQLAQILSDERSETWEVINLGVGDWGNAQGYLALLEYGLAYQPDLVISQVFPLNDICNNTLELAHLCKSQNDDYRPYMVLRDGRLEETWTHPLRQALRSRLISFGVLELLALRIAGAEEGTVDEIHMHRAAARGFTADPLLLTYASDERQPPQLQTGWKTTEAVLEAVYRTCQERGIAWTALVIPFEGRVNEAWPSLANAIGSFDPDVDYPEKRLARFLDSIEAPGLMLKPTFDANLDIVLPFIGGHLSAPAHTLTARTLADFLKENQIQ